MEFPFRLPSSIGAPSGHSGPYIGRLEDHHFRGSTGSNLVSVLDALGKNSARAQGLKKPITCGSMCSLMGQRIYLAVEDKCALGFIKVGTKQLFVAPPPLVASRSNNTCVQDAFKEIHPLCALDFYVHESCQRNGIGKRIFDTMLQQEGVSPNQIAYDRPSPKFLGFLRKYFGLTRYQPQNNNFVVFDEYFRRSSSDAKGSRSSSSRRGSGTLPVESIGYVSKGIVPGGPAHSGQKPPLMPNASAVACASTYGNELVTAYLPGENSLDGSQAGLAGSQRATALLGPPPSAFSSNSRPPLGASTLSHRGEPCNSASGLRAPWGTAADTPPRIGGPGVTTPLRTANGAAAAGMPSGGQKRSTSEPSKGFAPIAGSPSLPCFAAETTSLGSSGGSAANSSRRYASPLSHAGHRMLAL